MSGPLNSVARFWAGLDGVLTGSFVLPWVAAWVLNLVGQINVVIGGAPLPHFLPVHLFFASLMGILGVLWAVVRWRDPQPWLVRSDVVARIVVSVAILGYVFVLGAPKALLLFVVTELAGAAHQSWAIWRAGRIERAASLAGENS